MSSGDRWSRGVAYDGYVGRWSRLVADEFIPWLEVSNGATWIDVGCGTGELTRSILRVAAPSKVVPTWAVDADVQVGCGGDVWAQSGLAEG